MKLQTLLESTTVGQYEVICDLKNQFLILREFMKKYTNVYGNKLPPGSCGSDRVKFTSQSYDDLVDCLKEAAKEKLVCDYAHQLIDYSCKKLHLTKLDGLPSKISGDLILNENKLENLKDIHKHVKEIQGGIYAFHNPIKSHVLGVFLIKGIKRFNIGLITGDDQDKVSDIINKYLPEGRAGLPKAQNELIEAGYEEFAQI